MGLFKKTTGFVGKRISAPVKSVFVPQVTKQLKASKEGLSDSTAPFCPQCLGSRMELVNIIKQGENLERSEWECFNCGFQVDVKGSSVNDLKAWVEVNGADVYKAGKFYDFIDSGEGSAKKNSLIDKSILIARVFLFVSALFAIVFLYAAFTANKFLAFNSVLMTICLLFIGIINGYRAWQIQNNMLFSDNPRGQFHFWVKNYNWFARPKYEPFLMNNEEDEDS